MMGSIGNETNVRSRSDGNLDGSSASPANINPSYTMAERIIITENTIVEVKWDRIRNLIGFWIFGLCNNYAYVIMLTAAYDLLSPEYQHRNPHSNLGNQSNETGRHCNPISTGAILLADVLPSLGIKLVAPFLICNVHLRILIVVILSALSFVITSLSSADWMTFIGVICAAFSSGLGEVTFLSFSSHFDKDVVSTWSSGTGAAGVIGAVSYTGLVAILPVRKALQAMLLAPALMAACFWILLVHPPESRLRCRLIPCQENEVLEPILHDSGETLNQKPYKTRYTLIEKIKLIKPLLKYMVPLSLVYFAEYFINQGLMELIYFKGIWLNDKDQYHWYQVDYQVGVLISRSSVNCFQIKKLWILPILQFLNVIFLLFETYYLFLPSIWIALAFFLYEGLLGGSAYVNTFYRISQEVPPEHREFSMGVASVGDAIGIALAGAVAIPVHNALCRT